MKHVFQFLSDLKANNNREWFAANKPRYIDAKRRTDILWEALRDTVATVDHDAARLSLSDCTYRIYRDTRFSPDKTPYKTHIGIFINPPEGKKSLRCGYYLHLEPGESLVAAGTVCLPSGIVRAIRQSIYDNIDEYRSIVESSRFRKCLPDLGGNPLKTAPKGFPKDWEYIEYLRPRDFLASRRLPDASLTCFDMDTPTGASRLAESILPELTQAKRFNDFINYTIDELTSPEPPEEIPHIF